MAKTIINGRTISGSFNTAITAAYDNSTSGLEATNVQAALDEVVSDKVPNTRKVNNKQLNADITLTAADVGAVPTGSGASEIGYDNTESHLTATNVQDAIDSNASHIGGFGNVIGMRGWNQLVNTNALNRSYSAYGDASISDGILTYSASQTADEPYRHSVNIALTITSGHKYFVSAKFKTYATRTASINQGATTVLFSGSYTSNWTEISGVFTASSSGSTLWFEFDRGKSMVSGNASYLKEPMLIDLTALFGSGNEPTTVAEFRTMFPAEYYPYCSGSWADLLWTNPSPSNPMTSQTISLDLSSYNFIMIESRIYDGNAASINSIFAKGISGFILSCKGEIRTRDLSSNNNGVNIGNCLNYSSYNGSYAVYNDGLVPTRIYGIR